MTTNRQIKGKEHLHSDPTKYLLYRSRHQLVFSNGKYVAFLDRGFNRCKIYSFESEDNVKSSFSDFGLCYENIHTSFWECSIETVGIFFHFPRDHYDYFLENERKLEEEYRKNGKAPFETRRFQ
jgi:hypothetical protein